MNDSNKIIVVGFQNLLSGEFHKTIYDNYTIYLPEYEEYILKKGDILITNSLDAKDVIIVQWDEEEFALPSSEIAVISPLKIENTELIINILKNDIKEHLHNIIKNDNDFTINNEINNKLKILNEQLSTILEIKKSLNIEKKRIEPNKIVKFKKEELDNVRPITRLKLNQEKILFLVERIKELMISKYFISNEDKEIIQDLINDLLEYDFNKINRIFENMRGLIQQENTHLNSDDSTFIVYELNSLLNNMQKYVSRIDLMKFGMLKDLRSLHMISKVQEEEVIESDETTQEFYNEEIFLKSIIEELSSLGKIIQKELYKDIIDDEVKFNAFKEFTRSLLHEYGQPITNIRFNIQQIMRRIKKGKILDNDFLFERFNIILEETERTDELYKKISDTTTQNISIQSFKIADAIKKRISILGNILEEKNISINIEGELEVKINWDLIKFEQILINLINNSIYAIQKKNPKKGMIIFILKDLGSNVLIEYSDNGIGIPFEIREKIFTPFFTTKPQTEGSGLGMYIVLNIFRLHGGAITLDSSYTDGAKFLIKMPKQMEEIK